MANGNRNYPCVGLIAIFFFVQQLPSDSSYEIGLEHLYNYEHEEAIANFEKGIRKNPDNPMLYLRLAQSLLLRDNRDLGNIRFRKNDPGFYFLLRGEGTDNRAWQKRYNRLEKVIQLGNSKTDRQSNTSYKHYLKGALIMTDSAYLYEIFRERKMSAMRAVEGTLVLQPLLDDNNNPFHEAALFYDSVIRAQLGKNAPPGTAWILSGLTGLSVHLDDGMRDLLKIAAKESLETIGAQLAFIDIMSTLENNKNNNRHKVVALQIAQQLLKRYPHNPSIRYHTILLYRKNGQNAAANALRQETLEILRNDPRTPNGTLKEITYKITNAQ